MNYIIKIIKSLKVPKALIETVKHEIKKQEG